jgi:hypothetical protein
MLARFTLAWVVPSRTAPPPGLAEVDEHGAFADFSGVVERRTHDHVVGAVAIHVTGGRRLR